MKKLSLLIFVLFLHNSIIAQITLIPDYRFEQALIDLGIDTDETINGQMLTADALVVTELFLTPTAIPNYPYPSNGSDFYDGYIHDVTGIEAFVNLEHLVINSTMIEALNLDSLVQLKYLDCDENMLSTIDVSNNLLLEYLDITSFGDVPPVNNFYAIDLSNNPNINTLTAHGIKEINLNNNNNNENMIINVFCIFCIGSPASYIENSVCIKVDNVTLAQNNAFPYSEWSVNNANIAVNYADDLEQCTLGVSDFDNEAISIYPNPVRSGVLYFASGAAIINKVMVFDVLGRKILEQDKVTNFINLTHLNKGNYIVKMITDKGIQTEKIIVE